MSTPDLNYFVRPYGRIGEATLHVEWTQQDSDDFTDGELWVRLDEIKANFPYVQNPRLTVERLSGNFSLNGHVDIVYNSTPQAPENNIWSFGGDGVTVSENFLTHPAGSKADPNRESPGDIAIITRGCLPGDELFLRMTFRVKGTAQPQGILSTLAVAE